MGVKFQPPVNVKNWHLVVVKLSTERDPFWAYAPIIAWLKKELNFPEPHVAYWSYLDFLPYGILIKESVTTYPSLDIHLRDPDLAMRLKLTWA